MPNADTDPDDPPGLLALRRLLAIAASDTGQSRRVANVLLAWWNAHACGGFDLTELWSVEAAIRDDMLAVIQLIAHEREFPTAYGLGPEFEHLVQRWRPNVLQAHQ